MSEEMKFELSQSFYFESAHTLLREVDAEGSRRIHGHTYNAEITVRGSRNTVTGMVVDYRFLQLCIDRVRGLLDHRLLDEVPGLGAPTAENLCLFLWREFATELEGLASVRVARNMSGDSCVYRGGTH